MSPIHLALVRYLQCLTDARRVLSRPTCLIPFAALSLVELLVLIGYIGVMREPFASTWAPVLRFLFGEEVLHYPTHVLRMPEVLEWIRRGVGVVVGFALLGWGTRCLVRPLAEVETGRGEALVVVARRLVPMFVVNASFVLALVAISPALDQLGEMRVVGRLKPLWELCDVALSPLVMTLLGYAMFRLVTSAGSVVGALRFSLSLANQRPIETTLIVFSAVILTGPLRFFLANTSAFVRAGTPGWVSALAVCFVAWDLVVRCLVFASAVSLGLDRDGRAP